MGFLFGALFKKQFDYMIRNKYLYLFSALAYVIFIAFIVVDFITAEQAENYHRSARILFPAEFSKRLVLYELIAFICVMPFFSVFAFTITDNAKFDIWALIAGHRPCAIIMQKLMSVIIFIFDSLCTFTIVSLIAVAYYHDSTYRTILTAQGIAGLILVLYVCFTALLCTCIRKKEVAIMVAVAGVVLSVINIHLIGSWAGMLNEPRSLIDTMLAINPVTLVSGILGYDIMRSWFFYNTSQAVMFRFEYADAVPATLTCTALVALMYLLTVKVWKSISFGMLYKKWCSGTVTDDFPAIGTHRAGQQATVTALIAPDEKSLDDSIAPLCAMLSGIPEGIGLIKKGLTEIGWAIKPVYAPDETVESYLVFFANLYSVPWQERRQRISEILTICGLHDVRYTKIKDLGLSQKAMVSIARSLIHTPSSMIWHQVVHFMNEHYRNLIFDIAHHLSQQGITVVITATAANICFEPAVDHIVGIKNGTFVINTPRSELSGTMLKSFWS